MSRISENFLKFALALAEYETSCSLHDWYGSVVHFAYATEVRRGGAFDPARHSRCLALGQIETQTKRKNNYYLVSGIDYTFGQKKETTRMASTLMLAKSCSTRSRRDSFFLSGFLETPALFI